MGGEREKGDGRRRDEKGRRTMIVGVSAEEVAKEFGVGRCVAGPHVPDFVTQGIGDEFVFGSFHDVVGTYIWWLCVWVVRSV